MHKTYFFFCKIRLSLSNSIHIGGHNLIIGIKPAPGDHKSNLKKASSIPWEPPHTPLFIIYVHITYKYILILFTNKPLVLPQRSYLYIDINCFYIINYDF